MTIRRISVIPKPLGKPGHHYHDEEAGRDYRRIYAGLHWPRINNGTIVVIAEDMHVEPFESLFAETPEGLTAGVTSDERKLRVISEYANRDLKKLLARCQALIKITKVNRVFAETTDTTIMRLKRNSEFSFRLSDPPGIEDHDAHITYLNFIREKASTPDEKTLIFENCPELKKELNSLSSVPTAESFRNDYPYIVAFAFALLALETFPYKEPVYHPKLRFKPLDPFAGY